MAFRAVHKEWGAVFAHLPDLGCGQDWRAVWKVRPPVPLACNECGHRMHAKVSRHGLRFFAHAPGAPTCALALETIAHHLLKLELANAARAAGVHAEMEVRGPDGAWRADVLASDPGGAWRWALEAQLAPITADDITARIPLVNADGWLVAILDPDPRRIGQEQYALHAGTLLLFTSEDRQARFARVMKDYEPKPQGGLEDGSLLSRTNVPYCRATSKR